MKRDNRGFSMVELIIVLAILAIAALLGISGLSYVFGRAVKSCASEIHSSLGAVRINTMGKYETTLHIYRGTDGYYKQEWQLEDGTWVSDDPQKIGKSYLTLRYELKDGTSGEIDGNGIWIGFDRSSGKEREVDLSSTNPPPGSAGGVADIFTHIYVEGVITRDVEIIPATGKVQIH